MRLAELRKKSRFSRLARRIADNSGNAALEFALAFGLIGTPLMLGTSEIAALIYDSIELSNCAHAGAMYGMMSSTFASDTSGIQTAAQSDAADFGSNVTVTSSSYYACSSAVDGTQYTTQTAAAAVCPANASNHYLQFITVVASMSITPPVQIPGTPKSWTVNGVSTMEVQE